MPSSWLSLIIFQLELRCALSISLGFCDWWCGKEWILEHFFFNGVLGFLPYNNWLFFLVGKTKFRRSKGSQFQGQTFLWRSQQGLFPKSNIYGWLTHEGQQKSNPKLNCWVDTARSYNHVMLPVVHWPFNLEKFIIFFFNYPFSFLSFFVIFICFRWKANYTVSCDEKVTTHNSLQTGLVIWLVDQWLVENITCMWNSMTCLSLDTTSIPRLQKNWPDKW